MKKTAFLDKCNNILGDIQPDIRARLEAVIANPTPKTWDNAHSIILNGRTWMTLWQAWVAVDANAPRTGKVTDEKGRIVEGWKRIPDQLTLYRAIRHATDAA